MCVCVCVCVFVLQVDKEVSAKPTTKNEMGVDESEVELQDVSHINSWRV